MIGTCLTAFNISAETAVVGRRQLGARANGGGVREGGPRTLYGHSRQLSGLGGRAPHGKRTSTWRGEETQPQPRPLHRHGVRARSATPVRSRVAFAPPPTTRHGVRVGVKEACRHPGRSPAPRAALTWSSACRMDQASHPRRTPLPERFWTKRTRGSPPEVGSAAPPGGARSCVR